ncbi:Glyceraldehyde-3-phosphate dehydrogenase of plastid 2 isoform 1 [Hibiscus syriacus]|uniref:Glyceraldehyde-3-phosphate dehydrogenase of plastid 2 isoform 1 n=1 Tax=Hibiscus syriacus TaxID=106335 RepID=A0A6A2WZM5_HIBSY|nr:Glyceraldehyde-3-phosphate dehydrogenase of plastid 2 isoform 1 [Hibiscus syriacus]
MSVSFKYWNDCVDPEDLEAMWNHPDVRTEWEDAGETKGLRVHLSRDPDGQPYLTQTEMRAVAEIVTRRQFDSQVDPLKPGIPADRQLEILIDSFVAGGPATNSYVTPTLHFCMLIPGIPTVVQEMICAIAELESDRQPLAARYDKKNNLITIGLMQVDPKVAEWIVREQDYLLFPVDEDPDILYRPFVNVFFGASYLKWLSNFEGKVRTEEFVVRAYIGGGARKANHKSTLPCWKGYLQVKEHFQSRKHFDGPSHIKAPTSPTSPASPSKGDDLYWDIRVSSEDMEQMWNHPDVFKEWTKSKEIRGNVRFSCDREKRPYLSRVELRAIAEIIVSKYFSTRGINPAVLCALADIVSNRFIDGNESSTGLMGIDYSTAFWLYTAYRVDYAEDLTNPFASMYFGAAYLDWLSEYEGRERSLQFIFEAYVYGPKSVHLEETCPKWLKFEQILARYERTISRQGSCNII